MKKRLLLCLCLLVCLVSTLAFVADTTTGANAAKPARLPDVSAYYDVYYLQDAPPNYTYQLTATVCICPHGPHAGELALVYESPGSCNYYVGPRIRDSGLSVGTPVTIWVVKR